MVSIEFNSLSESAEKKIKFYTDDKISYFISSMLAGIYVGICMITILVMAGMLNDFAGIKILQGVSFAAALSLVVFAGADLFTGNVFVMAAGIMLKTVKPGPALRLCGFCYLGNFAGSFLVAALFWGTGYLKDYVLLAATNSIAAKTSPLYGELFVRGILCNILVCAAVWCVYRLKSESAKLILIFWSIYLFVICGFEHCIANMTLFSLGFMSSGADGINSLGLMLKNLAATTPGNILGGVMLALAYWSISRKSRL